MEIGVVISRYKFFLLFLFIVSFIIRSLVFVGYLSKNENYWQVDSNTYHVVAQQIANGHGISSADGSPHFYRLPGYPIFISIYYYFFGNNTKNVLWGQIFLASFIPILVFVLALTLFPGAILVAKFSSFFTALHLGFVLFSSFFMTETLFIFLLLLFFIFFFRKCFFWAGLFLGLASLVRPVGLYLLVVALVLLLLGGCRGERPTSKILKSIIFSCAWALPVFFWLIRNFLLTGYLFFHTLPGGHFLYLSAARTAMHIQNCSYQQARQNLSREVQVELAKKAKTLGRPLLEIESCKVHEQLAIKYFKQSPLITLKNWATDIFRTMFSLYSSELLFLDNGRTTHDYFKKDRSCWNMFERYLFPQTKSFLLKSIVWGEILFFLFLLLGFFIYIFMALVSAIRKNFKPIGVLSMCLPFMGLFIVIALSGGYARMRLPIEPLLIIFACTFWVDFLKIREKCE